MKEKPEIRRKSKPLKIHDEALDSSEAAMFSIQKLPTAIQTKEAAPDVLNFDHENHIRKSKGGQEENFKEMLVHYKRVIQKLTDSTISNSNALTVV